MQYWRDQGAPTQKLNLGLAAYGRAFTLSSASSNVGAPASGPGEDGCYTGEDGFWASYEVKLQAVNLIHLYPSAHYSLTSLNVIFDSSFQTCLYLEGVAIEVIPDQKVPYATTENQWVGFDNKDSLDAKVIICFIQTTAHLCG